MLLNFGNIPIIPVVGLLSTKVTNFVHKRLCTNLQRIVCVRGRAWVCVCVWDLLLLDLSPS